MSKTGCGIFFAATVFKYNTPRLRCLALLFLKWSFFAWAYMTFTYDIDICHINNLSVDFRIVGHFPQSCQFFLISQSKNSLLKLISHFTEIFTLNFFRFRNFLIFYICWFQNHKSFALTLSFWITTWGNLVRAGFSSNCLLHPGYRLIVATLIWIIFSSSILKINF